MPRDEVPVPGSWWYYEWCLARSAFVAPFWSSRRHAAVAAVILPLAGVAASFAVDLGTGVLLFLSVVGAAYLAMLLVLLLRQGFEHAKSLGVAARARQQRVETLERAAKLPPVQIERLHRAKQLAGLVERTVSGWRFTEDPSLSRNIDELDELAGYLAEYTVNLSLIFFLEAVHVRIQQESGPEVIWGIDRPSREEKQTAKADLRYRLEMVQADCDKALSEGVPLKRMSEIRPPAGPPLPTAPAPAPPSSPESS